MLQVFQKMSWEMSEFIVSELVDLVGLVGVCKLSRKFHNHVVKMGLYKKRVQL